MVCNDGNAELVRYMVVRCMVVYYMVVRYMVVRYMVAHHSKARFALVAGNRRASLSRKKTLSIVGIVDIVAHMMSMLSPIFVDSLDTAVVSVQGIRSVLTEKKVAAVDMALDIGVDMLAGWDVDMVFHMEPVHNLL